ncbi:MAG: hypothetical protein SCARUB_03301 [Candidatus Scalindua rubra]|uniref:Uncharacterized protein n=1 Tax=Candidatus Scalindua rubra TaxID=1872076 RepID=A0A1E3X7G8_9BACT|nr:MAG: hypothetical protein SCARUB_03301 [Candidatus Scalindua rubra]
MATFQELGKQYARRIREAFIADGFSRFKSISPYDLKLSSTLRELKAIHSEIDRLVYTDTNESLSEADKNRIITEIQKELHLPTFRQTEMIFKAASNDDLTDLANEIENILRGDK